MAAPNMTPSPPGQVNGAGATDALFLKVFGGEVLSAFRDNNVMSSRSMSRTISAGKSAQFPATWKATAAYHTPGNLLIGQVIKGNERVITIDDLLVADVFIANIDEAKSHFDFRAEYSFQAGAALARAMDKNLLQVGLLAARSAATVTGGDAGTAITNATARSSGDSLVASLMDAAQAMDEKNVPPGDRYAFVLPDQYYNLVNSTSKAVHKDYTSGPNGGVDSGVIYRVAGLEIVKTNNLPSTNINTGVATYQGDFTNTAALVMHRSACGTVKLLDLSVEMDYLIQYQGTMVIAKYALGHGILRPESAVEIKIA